MTSFGFYQGISDLYKEVIDLASDNIRCALLANTYTPDQTNDFLSDVSAHEISGGGYNSVLLTNKSVYTNGAQAIFDADDIMEWNEDSFTGARYILIYNDTGVAATSQLIALIDFGGNRNAPLIVPWNENGIFGFNSKISTFDVTDFESATDPLTNWTYSGSDWDEQVDPDTVPLTSDNFDTIVGAWEHYINCETAASPYGFDSVTDANGQLSIQGSVYKEGSNALQVQLDNTGTAAYGATANAAARSTTANAFWLNVGSISLGAGETIDIHDQDSVVILRISRVSDTQYIITVYSEEDAATYQSEQIYSYDPTGDIEWIHIIILWSASSAPAADDGYTYTFVNGELQSSLTGLDSDTFTITNIRYGAYAYAGTPEGIYYFDEIYNDDVGAPITVAVQQMQGRDYSMLTPIIMFPSIYAAFQTTSPPTEFWVEFDWKDILTDNGGSNIVICRFIQGVATFLDLVYDESNTRIRFNYRPDGGALTASNFVDISGYDDITIGIYYLASSAPAANDGIIQMYFNGEMVDEQTGLDTDTFDLDEVRYGAINVTNGFSLMAYGTMRYSSNDSVITIKDWAAQSGSYGMGYYISPSSSSQIYRDIDNTDTFSYEAQLDFSNLTLSVGDDSVVFRLYDTVSMNILFITSIENNGGDYRLVTDYWDGIAFQNVSTYTLPANKKAKIRVVLSEEQSALSSDGWMFVYIDDEIDDYVTGIDTPQTGGNRFIVSLGGGASSYGVAFLDNISFSPNEVMLNPLGASLDNPILINDDFDDVAVAELESLYFFIFSFRLGYIAPTQLGRPEVQTPGISDYKVRLKDQNGNIVAEFDNWLSLNFNHSQNHISNCRFEIDGRDSRTELFETDGQLEVWRKNDSVDLPWYIEWEGFIRTPNKLITPSDDKRYVSHSISYLHLAKRSSILWETGSAQAQKSGLGETIIKEIIAENLGSLALSASGRWKDHVYTGLSVEADSGAGASWDGEISQKNVLSVIRDIATASGLVYDIVGIGDGLYEFQIYEDQRGEDRSVTTGTNPLVFSTGYGNMITPLLSINRGDEITSVVVIGQGIEDEIQYEVVQSTAINDSPYNDIESVVKNTKLTTTDELRKAGLSNLEENKKIERLSFEIEQIRSAFYGKDYSWGTKVTAIFDDYNEDVIFDKVDILVNKESSQERIRTELSNKNNSDVQEIK